MFRIVLSMIVQCSWCKAIIGGDGKPPITHGICASCAKKM